MSVNASGKPAGWVTPYLAGALVILPPEPVRSRVNRMRRRYDPASADRIPAHVTVAQPFRRQPDAEAFRVAEQVLAGLEPFELTYGPLRTFLPYPCIWYDIQPAGSILAVRAALHATGLFNTDLPHTRGFIPHMSITDGHPGVEETERIFERVRHRVKRGSFPVEELAYTRPNSQMHFRTVRHLPFGQG